MKIANINTQKKHFKDAKEVSDKEMKEILKNEDSLRRGIQDINEGKYTIIG